MFLELSNNIFHTAFNEWLNKDLPAVKYIIKSTLASLLSLSICMYFNLSMPQTSVFTVFIVMQPFSGPVFSKSFYRLIGTFIGTMMALVLVGAYAQDRVSFTLFFALWVGLCAAIGFMSRNFMAYGFVLSGYTISLVTMPIITDRIQDIFIYSMDRLSEVVIGLLCASIISEILFPEKLAKTLDNLKKGKLDLLINTFKDSENIFDFDKQSINYNKDILGDDALRVNSNFETSMNQTKKLYHKRLNSEFMHISTTYFSLKNVINNNKDNSFYMDSIKSAYNLLEECLNKYSDQPKVPENIKALITNLKQTKIEIIQKVQKDKKQIIDDFDLIHDYNSTTHLLIRMISELSEYCTTYINFLSDDKKIKELGNFSQNLKFSTHIDNVLISIIIARSIFTCLIIMIFWMLSGSQYASFTVMATVPTTLLLNTVPNPVGAVKGFLIGIIIALIITSIYNFYIIPMYVTDVFSFWIFLSPIFAFISLFMILPGKSLIGFGIIALFMNTSIYNHYNMNFISFMDISLATILGLLISGFSFILFDFVSSSWIELRIKKALLKQIDIIFKEKLALQRVKLESISFDLIQKYSILRKLDNKSNQMFFRWVISTIEIGKAVIYIRINSTLFLTNKPIQIHKILTLIRKYFDDKYLKEKKEQLKEIKQNIEEFEHIHLNSANDQILLKDIYLNFSIIYSIIKNREFLPIKGEI
ncbi:hypothetical protein CRV08_07615 [Halarcobacter ebronensis]|uniref:Fusaric acid resistance protein n=1 Tax=Halarcobacter ebronensis TaxID=1462615 RepID=A0A4Q0YCK3_9BACT|nr:FUSC family protein [Halarcobacter ebronensis]RXJ68117.1 hypothetical protein CRV08_07615 [Halarcobacter ebronensis]